LRRKEARERRDVFYTAVPEAHAPGERKEQLILVIPNRR